MLRRILLATALTVATALTASGQDAAKRDQDALQGTWKVTKIVVNNKAAPDDLVQKITLTVEGDRLTVHLDKSKLEEVQYTLDAGATPRRMDWTMLSGPDKGQKRLAIYELEGDRLKLARLGGSQAASKRPDNFDGDVMILERVKK